MIWSGKPSINKCKVRNSIIDIYSSILIFLIIFLGIIGLPFLWLIIHDNLAIYLYSYSEYYLLKYWNMLYGCLMLNTIYFSIIFAYIYNTHFNKKYVLGNISRKYGEKYILTEENIIIVKRGWDINSIIKKEIPYFQIKDYKIKKKLLDKIMSPNTSTVIFYVRNRKYKFWYIKDYLKLSEILKDKISLKK